MVILLALCCGRASCPVLLRLLSAEECTRGPGAARRAPDRVSTLSSRASSAGGRGAPDGLTAIRPVKCDIERSMLDIKETKL